MKTSLIALVMTVAVAVYAGEWTEVGKIAPSNPNYKPVICVDRSNGDLYLSSGSEITISRDQGTTWTSAVKWEKGRHYNSNAFDWDWRPGRVALFPIMSKSAQMTVDGGKTWTEIKRPKHDGWTYGAVDWSADTPTRFLGKEHHSANLWFSKDGGENWEKLPIAGYFGLGFSPKGAILVGTIKGKKAVIPADGKPGIYRSEDDGRTWTLIHEAELYGKVKPRCFDGKVYWATPGGLLVSADDGKTWSLMPDSPQEIAWGPFFGKSADEIVVVGSAGIQKTTDGGKTWALIVAKDAMPAEMKKYKNAVEWDFAWDPLHDVYYGTTGAAGTVMKLTAGGAK